MGERAILYAFWSSSCSWRVRAMLCAKKITFEERGVDLMTEKQKTDGYRAVNPVQKVPALFIATESTYTAAYLSTVSHLSISPVFQTIAALIRLKLTTPVLLIENTHPLQSYQQYHAAHKTGKYYTSTRVSPLSEASSGVVDRSALDQQLLRMPRREAKHVSRYNIFRFCELHGIVGRIVVDGATIVESMAIAQYLEDTRPEPSLLPATPLLRARMREIVEVVVSDIQPLQVPNLRPFFEKEVDYVKLKTHFITRGLVAVEGLLSKTAGRFCIGDQLTLADICLVPQLNNATRVHKVPVDSTTYPNVARLFASLLKEDVFVKSHPTTARNSTPFQ